jgi:hypothetical protein
VPKIRDLGIKVIPETMRPPEAGGGGCGCTGLALTLQACGPSVACACTNITNPCFGCTQNITVQQCPLHTIRPCFGCTIVISHPCACTHIASIPCWGSGGCGFSPVCGGSIDPTIVQDPNVLTLDQVATLRNQLQQQIAALDEHAKTLGPKTAEEIDAREKQLNEELAQLKARRKEIK